MSEVAPGSAAVAVDARREPPLLVLSVSRPALAAACVLIGVGIAAVSLLTDDTPGIGLLQGLCLLLATVMVGVGAAIALRLPVPNPLARASAVGVNASLILVGLLFAAGMGEVGIRVVLAARHDDIRLYQPSFVTTPTDNPQFDRRRFTDHPFLPYAPRPYDARTINLYHAETGQLTPYTYSQNSLGFRGPERPLEKPSLTKRIITLGGSTTWDGPTDDYTWPSLLEAKLNAHYASSGFKVEVINMATEGFASPMSLVLLAFDGVMFEPDLVISYDGVNDNWLTGWTGLTPDYSNGMGKFDEDVQTLQSRLPKWMYRSYLVSWASKMYDVRVGNNSAFFWANDHVLGQVLHKLLNLKYDDASLIGIEYFERNLRLMRGISEEYGARFIASTAHWVTPDDRAVRQNAYLREAFRRDGIDYLDLDAILPHDDWSIHVDTVHWTDKGYDVVANEWLQRITRDDLLGLNHSKAQ